MVSLKMAEPQIRQHVQQYLDDHKGVIQKAVTEFLEAQNLTLLTVGAMHNLLMQDMVNFTQDLAQRIRQGY